MIKKNNLGGGLWKVDISFSIVINIKYLLPQSKFLRGESDNISRGAFHVFYIEGL